jgi:hypothetical protein
MSQIASAFSSGRAEGVEAKAVADQPESSNKAPNLKPLLIDPEEYTSEGIPGYLVLSAKMMKWDELAIFRIFSDLNMLNLLSLQAELMELRSRFYYLASQRRHRASVDDYSQLCYALASERHLPSADKYPQLWFLGSIKVGKPHLVDFSRLYGSDAEEMSPERDLLNKIRTKLKEYSGSIDEKIVVPLSKSFQMPHYWKSPK